MFVSETHSIVIRTLMKLQVIAKKNAKMKSFIRLKESYFNGSALLLLKIAERREDKLSNLSIFVISMKDSSFQISYFKVLLKGVSCLI